MINAIGIIKMELPDEMPPNTIIHNSDNILVELIDLKRRKDFQGEYFLELICKFNILLDENDNCKIIQDYASLVHPHLNKYIRGLCSTQIHKLSNIEPSLDKLNLKHISKML